MGPLVIFMGRVKTTLWMHVRRIWCTHTATITQSVMFKDVPVPVYWQCHKCGVEWGDYDPFGGGTVTLKAVGADLKIPAPLSQRIFWFILGIKRNILQLMAMCTSNMSPNDEGIPDKTSHSD